MDWKKEEIMASALLLMGFGFIFAVIFIPISESGQKYADTALGFILGTALATVINYLWGSSAGSTAKSKTIEELNKKGGTP